VTEWQPIGSAPKTPRDGYFGPRILLTTVHHGQRFVFIGRYNHGAHKRFLDEAETCLSAGDEGDYWMPLPPPPTE